MEARAMSNGNTNKGRRSAGFTEMTYRALMIDDPAKKRRIRAENEKMVTDWLDREDELGNKNRIKIFRPGLRIEK